MFGYRNHSMHCYRYYLFSTGTTLKPRFFNSRIDAEAEMYNYCAKHGIQIECSELDKHERKYTNHAGVRFYINRAD